MATSPVSPSNAFKKSFLDKPWATREVSCSFLPSYRAFPWSSTWSKKLETLTKSSRSSCVSYSSTIRTLSPSPPSWSVKSTSAFSVVNNGEDEEPFDSGLSPISADSLPRAMLVFENDVCEEDEGESVLSIEAQADGEELFQNNPPRFVFSVGTKVVPHPAKVEKGGEDAHFYLTHKSPAVLCVADGVGGWAEDGIDPALYSREFVLHSQAAAEEGKSEHPEELLDIAHRKTESIGATTCVLATLNEEGVLKVANVGDSGLRVFRDGALLFGTPAHQHYFDCPFQFGSDSPDSVADAQLFELALQAGDTLVLGTDGLFDNVFDRDIAAMVSVFQGEASDAASKTAAALATLAAKHSQDDDYRSPYCQEALTQGYDLPWWQKVMGKELTGGKVDDITVLVANVLDCPTRSDAESAPAEAAAVVEL